MCYLVKDTETPRKRKKILSRLFVSLASVRPQGERRKKYIRVWYKTVKKNQERERAELRIGDLKWAKYSKGEPSSLRERCLLRTLRSDLCAHPALAPTARYGTLGSVVVLFFFLSYFTSIKVDARRYIGNKKRIKKSLERRVTSAVTAVERSVLNECI